LGLCFFFVKVPVGTIGKHVKRHFSAENISFEIIKVLVGTIGKHVKRDFSAENISFEIRIFLIKVLVHPSATIHPFRTYPIFGH
jgi:hypothetical protein